MVKLRGIIKGENSLSRQVYTCIVLVALVCVVTIVFYGKGGKLRPGEYRADVDIISIDGGGLDISITKVDSETFDKENMLYDNRGNIEGVEVGSLANHEKLLGKVVGNKDELMYVETIKKHGSIKYKITVVNDKGRLDLFISNKDLSLEILKKSSIYISKYNKKNGYVIVELSNYRYK